MTTPRHHDHQAMAIMANAINMERMGRTFFLRAAKGAKGEEARQTFLRLAQEEETHIEALEEMFNVYGDPGGWSTYQEILSTHEDRLDTITFFDGKLDRALLANSGTEALALAQEHERYSIAFYREKSKLTTDPLCRDFLADLAAMEEEHLNQLAEPPSSSRSTHGAQRQRAP